MKPYYQDASVTLYHGDCRGILPQIPRPDVVITDPPFNVGKDYGTSNDALPTNEYAALMGAVAATCERQAWVTPNARLSLFVALLPGAHPVVVRRGAQGPKRWGWYDQFDLLLVRGKPCRYVSNLWDDIRLKGEGYFFREEHFDHPGYTPYQVLARLVALMSEPAGLVIDPFAGTGTTLHAAKAQSRKSIGIEIEERYCEIAAKRCAQEVIDFGAVA